ncbi:MAG: molybdate ABC transporter substrate-binding protein [Myxococcales bacterium]|nr:MAG: molybdate ABC transporter substrate-binding protein [Myxococcales bacterium]
MFRYRDRFQLPKAKTVLAMILLVAVGFPVNAAHAQETEQGQDITIFAAASLTDVLPLVAADWQARTGHKVTFSFDASSRLAKQIEQGAPADLFYSADREWMDYLDGKGIVVSATRVDLLGNELVAIAPANLALDIKTPSDLAKTEVKHLALAGETVPAGKYARAALAHFKLLEFIKDRVVNGNSVRLALEYVARDEAEAGIVYRTDAAAQPKVRVVFAFPQGSHPPIIYPAAVVRSSRSPETARGFLEFCRSPQARLRFETAGFIMLPATKTP